jgi:DNA-binding CsgD family transcriptional regulator
VRNDWFLLFLGKRYQSEHNAEGIESVKQGEISRQQHIGAMELFGAGGFSFYFAYALISFWWLFAEFPASSHGLARGAIQAFAFAGIPVCYIAVALLKKRLVSSRFTQMASPIFLLLASILPLEVLLERVGVALPLFAYLIGSFCAGLAGGFFSLRWLDGCGSARIHRYLRFTSAGVAGGALLLFVAVFTTSVVQPLFAMLYLIVSFLFMNFLGARTETSFEPILKPRREFLPFIREIEPSIFIYGIVFGLAFALLMSDGSRTVLWGMLAVLLGAGVVLLLDVMGVKLNITTIQRVLLVVMVATCLLIPFNTGWIRTVSLCCVIASWAAFNAVNWAMLVRMSVAHKLPVFYSVAAGAAISPFGFLVGWLSSLAFAYSGFSSTFLSMLMLALAFLLVMVVMLFFPNSTHHEEPGAEAAVLRVESDELSERALFRMKVKEVARFYALSPRECDVLGYLVKGRNAGYIQKKLMVSPHTAKSHIYNIYRKLDIHSQQKLMDFVEEYPIEIAPSNQKHG